VRAGAAASGRSVDAVQLTLLARTYCHLCDDMAAALAPIAAAHGATVAVVDVDVDPALEAAYGGRVPVLFLGAPGAGRELCHFHLDAARVTAALEEGVARPARRPEIC
jgi:thiol-disulfide isomerase/thioredoxin